MAATVGISGLVTSWAGTGNTQLIGAGCDPMRFSLDMVGDEADSTALAASLVQATYLKGLRSWSGSMSGRRSTASIGSAGSVTFSPGYTANIKSFEVVFECDQFDATILGSSATSARWREFLPGLIRVSGSYETYIDGTTALAPPAGGSEPAPMTLALGSSESFAFSAFATRAAAAVATNAINTAAYSFRGSGDVTTTASGDAMVFDAGSSIATPGIGSLVLQAATSRTYTGDAFWRRIRISNPVDQLVTIDIDFQGTGALTPA